MRELTVPVFMLPVCLVLSCCGPTNKSASVEDPSSAPSPRVEQLEKDPEPEPGPEPTTKEFYEQEEQTAPAAG